MRGITKKGIWMWAVEREAPNRKLRQMRKKQHKKAMRAEGKREVRRITAVVDGRCVEQGDYDEGACVFEIQPLQSPH
jgi:hypothetical protein